jgi:hypothetical protein
LTARGAQRVSELTKASYPTGVILTNKERSRHKRGKLEDTMGAWSKIDDLRTRVAAKPLIDVGSASTLEQAQEVLQKTNFAPDRLVVMGWEILLSRRSQESIVLWHFSAKLHPQGRSSTENDWKVVGQIAARIGAPRDPVLMPNDPSAAIHWSWTEQ